MNRPTDSRTRGTSGRESFENGTFNSETKIQTEERSSRREVFKENPATDFPRVEPVAMSKKPQFPTAIQNVAINLVFAVLSEQRCNRSQKEYQAIMAKLSPLKILIHKINDLLTQLHEHSKKTGEMSSANTRRGRGALEHRNIERPFKWQRAPDAAWKAHRLLLHGTKN